MFGVSSVELLSTTTTSAPGTSWSTAQVIAPVPVQGSTTRGRSLATRRAANYYVKSTGHLPPPLQKDKQDAFIKAVDDQVMDQLDKKNRKT